MFCDLFDNSCITSGTQPALDNNLYKMHTLDEVATKKTTCLTEYNGSLTRGKCSHYEKDKYDTTITAACATKS